MLGRIKRTSQEENPHISFYCIVTETRLSATENVLNGRHISVTIQLFAFYEIKNKYLSLNHSEKKSQTVCIFKIVT